VIGVNKYKPVNEAADRRAEGWRSTVRRLQIDKLARLKKSATRRTSTRRWRR